MKAIIKNMGKFANKFWANVRSKGLTETLKIAKNYLKENDIVRELSSPIDYDEYVRRNRLTSDQKRQMAEEISRWEIKPIISVVIPVYNTEEKWLRQAIESVTKQVYPYWELCICDDNSPNKHVREILRVYSETDKRIKVFYSTKSLRIAGATNKAIEMATGDFVGFLDHDDELTEDALYQVAKAINKDNPDLIYSDEDKMDLAGRFCEPFFKPDWSPDYLLSTNYICHFSVYRKSIGDELGWLRTDFEGSQDYDLVLRFTERTDKIYHIDKVLYHWRKIPGSTAVEQAEKSYASDAGRKALEETVKRRGFEAEVIATKSPGHFRVKRKINGRPKVSIIIPIRDKVYLLKKCIESIENLSTYSNYEIIVVDNGSVDEDTLNYLSSFKYKVLGLDVPFNYSFLNNQAVKEATGELILLLNNDMEVISESWLESMIEHAQRPEVGVVGSMLYYSNNTIQHAGVILGLHGVADHSHKFSSRGSKGYFNTLHDIRNYSAVTGACMMVKKEIYQVVGGLNEQDLAVAFNDVDLCLRILEVGYLCVFTPYAELYHHESVSRGKGIDQQEVDYMMQRWGHLIRRDPYYNLNLSLIGKDFLFKYTSES